ncbi:MAG: AAA-like domain-containing protein [Prevotellaceae bacterium]|jgi:hypothetical protein|nr:AAA-like domain-containing protein [Prevotellaceae bacterium]
MKYFNVAGPCFKDEHYMIDAEERLSGVEQLIDTKQYFVIHAARQSGKTTYLLDLADRLNQGGMYYAAYCSLESLQMIINPEQGIPLVVKSILSAVKMYKLPDADRFAENADYGNFANVLKDTLSGYCALLDKPLVLLFDEVDTMSEGTLITFLRQLRNGFVTRGVVPFVHSLSLVGMRNIRDYKAKIRSESETLGSASPFNIVTESLTIKSFTKEQIEELYSQHTEATGQIFEPEAVEFVWQMTQGQPWLVNAAAREAIVKLLGSDYSKPVTAALFEQAIKNILLRRDVHIDSLLERLKESSVQRVIEPMLLGEVVKTSTNDYTYTSDMGLIKVDECGKIVPANPIYGEVMIRELNQDEQDELQQTEETYQMPRYFKDGRIDMDFLMTDFQEFWRENSEIWVERFQYKEAAPHLILMAFLQRIINGGGQILREYAAGRGRMDLCVVYQGNKYPIELKLQKDKNTVERGLTQLNEYMDKMGAQRGWLCIFNRKQDVLWEDKIYMKSCPVENGKMITIVGL